MAENEERPLWKRLWLLWVVLGLVLLAVLIYQQPWQQEPTITQPAEETELAQVIEQLNEKLEDLPSAEDIASAVSEAMAAVSTPEPESTQSETCQTLPNYDRPPQPQIGHPSVYVETGVNDRTKCWVVPIKEGFVAIIGGFNVDGVSNGVYRAIPGPNTATVEVTDGFALVIVEEVAREEFCFRVGQAIEYGWAHKTVEPLPSWVTCKAPVAKPTPTPAAEPTATPTAAAECKRRETGQEKTLRFKAGEAVYGWRIQLDDGRPPCDGGECYLPSAPVGGEVTSGVICPWPAEIEGVSPWNLGDPN